MTADYIIVQVSSEREGYYRLKLLGKYESQTNDYESLDLRLEIFTHPLLASHMLSVPCPGYDYFVLYCRPTSPHFTQSHLCTLADRI